ncbi:hypothetical protein AB0F91_38285 [Amycolatopsis sp. NPDC023774]|uniref:hypothetical protein n=1 Tax=Amycolatopsis sp. NPDC023774 TaxID=3155015 RepID=UPI0033CE69AE
MTAYNSYLKTEVLHTLQEPATDVEGERSFLAVCQVQELCFKNGLGSVHGKSSSVQSWKYRDLVFPLGVRPHELADPVASMPDQHSALLETLREPSVYDDVVALPGRRGLSISDEVLHRDPSTQHEPHQTWYARGPRSSTAATSPWWACGSAAKP